MCPGAGEGESRGWVKAGLQYMGPKVVPFGVRIQNSIREPQKGTTLGPMCSMPVPIVSIVVPFWGYLIGS